MRNSEVIEQIETVNDVLQNRVVGDSQLSLLIRYADMGVAETGKTGFRLVSILASELKKTREGLAKLVKVSPADVIERAIEDEELTPDDDIPLDEVEEEQLEMVGSSRSVFDPQENDQATSNW